MKKRTGGRVFGERGESPAEDYELKSDNRRDNEQFSEKLSRHHVRRYICGAVFLILVIGLIWYWFGYRLSRPYTHISEVWACDITTTAAQSYCPFSDGILQYGASGAAFYNSASGASWSTTYDMKNPAAAVSDDYALIYDRGAKTAVILSASQGYTGSVLTELPITKGTVSGFGVAALLVENELSNNILFYDRTGTSLDITVKTLMSESGYPMDMCFSPDGQTMIASFVYVDSGIMQNRVVFYSFDTSKNTTTHVIAAFQQYGDTLFADVEFLSDERAAAFGDGKIVLYSMEDGEDPKELTVIEPVDTITNMAYDDKHIAFTTKDGDLVQSRVVYLYNTDGSLLFDTKTNFDYSDIYMGNGGVFLTGSSTLQYFDLEGKELYKGSLDSTILQIAGAKKASEFILVTNQKFLKIKLMRG